MGWELTFGGEGIKFGGVESTEGGGGWIFPGGGEMSKLSAGGGRHPPPHPPSTENPGSGKPTEVRLLYLNSLWL